MKIAKENRIFGSLSKWKVIVAEYEQPHFWRASWQIVNSIGAYIALWFLMYISLSFSLWLFFALVILAGGLLVRIFIIFHDCIHGSFFKSRQANKFWGFIAGILTFTPYSYWRLSHLNHHGSSGNLDKRGLGDIWTLTVSEYLQASKSKKLLYRFLRQPFIQFIIGPILLFLVYQRIPFSDVKPKERKSIWLMNFLVIGFAALLISIFGLLPWALIQLSTLAIGSSIGVWMFYVQHQYEDAYWEQEENWDFVEAALLGSSYYKLPRILQWFTGNIGFHHIHHLSPRIPNYHLELCHYSNKEFNKVKTLTLLSSFKLAKLRLWDEKTKQLISFQKLKRLQRSSIKNQFTP